MPNLLAKPPAFKPPPSKAHINWNHTLADGLLWLVMPGDDHRQEIVNGGIGQLQTNMSWHGASPIGAAAASSSGANSGIYYPLSSANRLTQLAEQWTMAGWWRIDAVTSFEHFFCLPNTASGWSSPFGWITFQRNSTGDSGRVQMLGAISGSINSATGYLLTDGQYHHYAVVGRTSTGTLEWWRDGKLFSTSSAALSGTASISTPVQTPIVMGRQGPGGDNTAESCQGSMAMFGIWKRAMPGDAIQRLYSQPFAFLRATTPRYRAYVTQSTVLFTVTVTPSLTTTTTLSRSVAHSLSASLSGAASCVRGVGHTLAASVSTSSSLARVVSKPLPLTSTTTASVSRAMSRNVAASLSTTATVVRTVRHTLSASLTTSALVSFVGASVRNITIVSRTIASQLVSATRSRLRSSTRPSVFTSKTKP